MVQYIRYGGNLIWRKFDMKKILIIEDDADIREMLIDYLNGDG